MAIEIIEAAKGRLLKEFVEFPYKHYKGDKFWVPPIKTDELKSLQAQTNPCFQFCEVNLWIAKENGKTVGRIGAIINNRYIEKTGERAGRFTRLEFTDSREVAQALTGAAEKWCAGKGCHRIHGPLGFTNLDHQAMLIEGFSHLPSIGSEYHKSYYRAHLEALGYAKEIDWVEFRLTIPAQISDKSIRVADAVMQRAGLQVKRFTKSSELQPWGNKLFKLMDLSFADLFSYVPFNDEMIDFYVKKYMPILNPRFVKIILDKEGEMAAFIVGLPSLSEAFQKAGGRLLPFGFWHILKAYKKPKVIDLLLTGIHPKAQGMGYAALLITELQKTALENGIGYAETTGILENNMKAIQTWKNFEHIQHKRKRCFTKKLI
jgi:GNAT superfamily N-acetyltransferase